MKDKIKSKLSDFIARHDYVTSYFTSLPRDTDLYRRIAIGGGLGLFLAFILSLFIGQGSSIPNNFSLDTEQVTLESFFQDKDISEELEDSLYPKFSGNLKPLTDIQKSAIENNKTRLSIVVYDLGRQKSLLQDAVNTLSPDITLALSSHTPIFNAVSRDLKQQGFETWLTLDTQTLALNTDNGPHALSHVNDYDANIPMLDAQKDGKSNVTGVVLASNSIIVESESIWKTLSQEIFAEGYGLLDTTQKSFPSEFFYHQGNIAPYIKGDWNISTNMPEKNLRERLTSITERLKINKNGVLSISLYTPRALDILNKWVDSLQADGIVLIPLSAQAKQQ
jgi:polysaccharide deacetylase 2 family uncharacterized protein YibQ